jgi:hypothetical protein
VIQSPYAKVFAGHVPADERVRANVPIV